MLCTFLKQHQKQLASALSIIVLSALLFFVLPHAGFAVENGSINDAATKEAKQENTESNTRFVGTIYSVTTSVGGAFLWLGGSLLDYSVIYLVIGMGEYMEANLGVVIDQMWVIVRDLFNILFIFGLIWIGFRTILFSGDNSTKKALGYLIIAALMINFSLFITKAIIDFSNVAAFQIHTAIGNGIPADSTGYTINTGSSELTLGGQNRTSVTTAFMNATKITSYADGSFIDEIGRDTPIISGRAIAFGILMMFFMMIAGFVFAAGALILIGRFVALVIFMILSPAMFLGMIFPQLSMASSWWWKRFLRYAFVAPAYLFMLYLSLWALSGIGREGSFATAFHPEATGNSSFFIILFFCIVTGFLVASLKVANMMGAYGSEGAWSLTQSIGKWFGRQGNYAARYPDRALRRFAVGRVSKGVQNAVARSQVKNGIVGKTLRWTGADKLADEYTKAGRNWKPAGLHQSHKDLEEYEEQRRTEMNVASRIKERSDYIKAGRGVVAGDNTINKEKGIDRPKERAAMVRSIKKLTGDEMKKMNFEKEILADNVVLHITDSQIKSWEESGKMTTDQLKKLKDKRKDVMIKVAQFDDLGKEMVGNKSQRELLMQRTADAENIPMEVLQSETMAQYLTPKIITKVDDEAPIAEKDRIELEKNINRGLKFSRGSGMSENAGTAYQKQWRQWTRRDGIGARFNLDITEKDPAGSEPSSFVNPEQGSETVNSTQDMYRQARDRQADDNQENT